MPTPSARCPQCRVDVPVPDTYAHGDTLPCNMCHFQLRVLRTDAGSLRLVVADAAPLREQLAFNRSQVDKLESELAGARASFGIGANGFGVAVIYVLVQIVYLDRPWEMSLLITAVAIALGVGVALEVANYLFLAKRKRMERIQADMAQLRASQKQLETLIRDSDRSRVAGHGRPAGGA